MIEGDTASSLSCLAVASFWVFAGLFCFSVLLEKNYRIILSVAFRFDTSLIGIVNFKFFVSAYVYI